MAAVVGPNDMTGVLQRLLAEEHIKLSKCIHDSHASVASRFEQILAEEQAFPRFSCNKVIKPLFDSALPPPVEQKDTTPWKEVVFAAPVVCVDTEDKTVEEVKAPAGKCADEDGCNAQCEPAQDATGGNGQVAVKAVESKESVSSCGQTTVQVAHSTHSTGSIGLLHSADNEEDVPIRKHEEPHTATQRCVASPTIESIFAVLIFANAVVMGFEQQYWGMDAGYRLQARGAVRPAKEVWPYAEVLFDVAENFFGLVFTAEVVVKAMVLRCEFVKSAWNIYDSLVISCWIIGKLGSMNIAINPQVLRLARMVRLLRILRFVKAFQIFDVLNLLVRSMIACMAALLWSAVFLALVMMGVAILLVYLLQEQCENEAIPLEERMQLYKYFGTFANGMFSMFELTMGNFVPISRLVIVSVNEWYMLFFIAYKTLVGFAVMKVITAIFNAETFRITQSDDDIMLLHKERQVAMHSARMHRLLCEGDVSRDGFLSLEEFQDLMCDQKIRKWLLAQEIELSLRQDCVTWLA
eukprot:TRINITY_DN12603_c0_g2_i2.p1 TRINITY_DN12603_c0_g2~~TRINITY_DN12603_c0_g2_i2.p1  ORF type:complete len:523 (+),score=93.28 TRINITY_DN12603_c0_g2_i2:140-1708(+)